MTSEAASDIYCTGVQVLVSPFEVILNLSQRVPVAEDAPPVTVGHVRMSLELAKVLAIMLRKGIKAHEDALGNPIALLPDIYQRLGISPQEDW